jgi:hypothetical protein
MAHRGEPDGEREYENELVRDADVEARLNVRGEAGWELVSLAPYTMLRSFWYPRRVATTEYVAVYKRRKP